jgi:HAD superfamily hydrolase (TIGR01457 family)
VSTGGAVLDRYDALLVDLDGVVYRGDHPVPGASVALAAVRKLGVPLVFLTNNSARTPRQVAQKLAEVGVGADPDEILTSGQATAALLMREGATGTRAFVIGERGVREALQDAGVDVVDGEVERADVVVVGWDRSVDYDKLRTAALLVQRGARLIATNADATYPAPDGLWPGAGSILAAVTTASGATPVVVGKPGRPMFEAAAERVGARDPLVVGDRLDTDIAGAAGMGWDSLFVWSGAHGPHDLPGASHLPTYAAPGLGILFEPVPPVRPRPARAGDMGAVAELLSGGGLSADGTQARLDRTIVAEDDDGTVVATATTVVLGESALIRSVAVRGDRRGRGVGLLTAAAAVRAAVASGAAVAALLTETAAPFFERLGFVSVDRSALPAEVAADPQAAEECRTAQAMVLDLALVRRSG